MSVLEQSLADYLQLRHSLGHELAEAGWLLPDFVAYLDARGLGTVTVEAALAWAQPLPTGRVTSVGARRMTAARGFARYLSGIDARTQIPPLGLMPRRQRWRRPFIYTPADIDTVRDLARRSIVSPLRAATYDTVIGLLAVSGLRIGEAIALDRSDVDWAEGVLVIRESKFGKSRLVPLHTSSMRALEGYARLRDQLQPRPKDASFFVSLNRTRLLYAVVQDTLDAEEPRHSARKAAARCVRYRVLWNGCLLGILRRPPRFTGHFAWGSADNRAAAPSPRGPR